MLSEEQARICEKYGKDGPFCEPVVRCDSCAELVLVSDLRKRGACSCSNTRVRNVRFLKSMEEYQQCERWAENGEIDPDWLKLWEPEQ